MIMDDSKIVLEIKDSAQFVNTFLKKKNSELFTFILKAPHLGVDQQDEAVKVYALDFPEQFILIPKDQHTIKNHFTDIKPSSPIYIKGTSFFQNYQICVYQEGTHHIQIHDIKLHWGDKEEIALTLVGSKLILTQDVCVYMQFGCLQDENNNICGTYLTIDSHLLQLRNLFHSEHFFKNILSDCTAKNYDQQFLVITVQLANKFVLCQKVNE